MARRAHLLPAISRWNVAGKLEDNEGLIPYSIRMIKEKKIDFGRSSNFV
jgi:hypothetical protein